MSLAATRAVWAGAPASGGELLVLLALADHADDAGWCWPSAQRLAAYTRLSRRQVFRHVRRLEQRGLLEVERRAGPAAANRYRLVTTTTPPPGDTRDTTDDAGVAITVTPTTPAAGARHDATHDAGDITPVTPTSRDGDAGVTRSLRDLPSFSLGEQESPHEVTRAYEALVRLHARYSATRTTKADAELRAISKGGVRASDVAAVQHEIAATEENAHAPVHWPYVAAILRRVQADRAAGRDPWPGGAADHGTPPARGRPHSAQYRPRTVAPARESPIPAVRHATLVPAGEPGAPR